MSQSTSILAEPRGEERISDRTLSYVAESARDDMFDLVIRNCVEAGVTKATLSKRLGKDPAQVTRLLGAPGNWTIDTVATILFAIDGQMLQVNSCRPMQEAVGNMRYATCFVHTERGIARSFSANAKRGGFHGDETIKRQEFERTWNQPRSAGIERTLSTRPLVQRSLAGARNG